MHFIWTVSNKVIFLQYKIEVMMVSAGRRESIFYILGHIVGSIPTIILSYFSFISTNKSRKKAC